MSLTKFINTKHAAKVYSVDSSTIKEGPTHLTHAVTAMAVERV